MDDLSSTPIRPGCRSPEPCGWSVASPSGPHPGPAWPAEPSLSPVGVAALQSWHTLQSAEQLRACTAWQRGDYVFTTESGRLLDQRNAARSYGRALAAAGVAAPRRFHLLRHTAASLMLAGGAVSDRTASEVARSRHHQHHRRHLRARGPSMPRSRRST